MNKREAATFLGISEKTLERIVKRRELFPQFNKGKNGKYLLFDNEQLAEYKVKRDAPQAHALTLASTDQTALAPTRRRQAPTDRGDSHINIEEFSELLAMALDRKAAPILTIKQAAIVFNVTQKFIETAIAENKLKKYRIGTNNSFVVKRSEIARLIDELD